MAGTILEPGQIEAAASKPPFTNLPPRDLFALRSARLAKLAEDHPLADYLRLLAGVCQAQQQVLDNPPASAPLDPARTRECFKHAMPPLAADTLVREGAWLPLLDAWLDAFAVPDNLSVIAAIDQLRRADSGQRKAWAVALVSGQYDSLPPALVPFSAPRCNWPGPTGCSSSTSPTCANAKTRRSAPAAAHRPWPG